MRKEVLGHKMNMNTQKEQERKNEKVFFLILLIFVALIIIIFLLIKDLGHIDHRPRIPTGNIDIFDIIFQKNNYNNNCSCTCNSCQNDNCPNCTNTNNCINNNGSNSCNGYNNSNGSGGNNNGNGSGNNNNSNGDNDNDNDNDNGNTSQPPNNKNGIEVLDKQTEYSHNAALNIFTNSTYYVVDDKIAPATENSYQFVIRNHNDFNIKYSLELNEENKYKVNMKYRLKLNGVYVAGNNDEWLTYNELNQYNIALSANNYDVYTLDWKWVESENDTEVGENINSNYKLGLKITAFEY